MGVHRDPKKKETWRAEVYIDGNRVAAKAGFPNKSTAQKWHDTQKGLFHIDPDKITENQKFRFDDLLQKYRNDHLQTLKPGTIRRYEIDITYRIQKVFSGASLEKISNAMITSFRSKIMSSELSNKSVNNCIDLFSSILKKGVKWGMLKKSPCDLERLKIPAQSYDWWENKNNLATFLNAANKSRYYAAFYLALETGMRLGEIVGLSKADVNFDLMQIRVRRQWLEKEKCYGPPKHNKPRTIRLDPSSALVGILKSAIENSSHDEIIFTTRNGRRVLNSTLAGDTFQRIVKKAGLPRICFHGLRHTYASWYMINVGDIWSLMSILGHQSIKTTMRYAHLSTSHQKTFSVGNVIESRSQPNHNPALCEIV